VTLEFGDFKNYLMKHGIILPKTNETL